MSHRNPTRRDPDGASPGTNRACRGHAKDERSTFQPTDSAPAEATRKTNAVRFNQRILNERVRCEQTQTTQTLTAGLGTQDHAKLTAGAKKGTTQGTGRHGHGTAVAPRLPPLWPTCAVWRPTSKRWPPGGLRYPTRSSTPWRPPARPARPLSGGSAVAALRMSSPPCSCSLSLAVYIVAATVGGI
jgi:hypothetical protein